MFKNILVTAVRNLWRNRRYSIFNLTNLTVGLAATIFIWTWAQRELTYDNYHKDADRIYRIVAHIKIGPQSILDLGTTPYLLGQTALEQIPAIEATTQLTLKTGKKFKNKKGNEWIYEDDFMYIAKDWFSMFDFKFIDGSPELFDSKQAHLILTADKAKQYFGVEKVVGQTLKIDSVEYIVQGVIANHPSNSIFQYGILLPIEYDFSTPSIRAYEENWSNSNYINFIKLQEGANVEMVAQQLQDIVLANQDDDGDEDNSDDYKIQLQKLEEIHLGQNLISGNFAKNTKQSVLIFSLIGALILLMVCINYISLTTARVNKRLKEISVRKIIGAGKKHIIFHLLSETILLTSLAIVIILALLPFVSLLLNQQLELDYHFVMDGMFWLLILSVSLITIFLAGIYPALTVAAYKPLSYLHGLTNSRMSKTRFRSVLVITQFTIALVLGIGAAVIFLQQQFIYKEAMSFGKAATFSLEIPLNLRQNHEPEFFNKLQQELLNQASIENTSNASSAPIKIGSTHSGSCKWDGKAADYNPSVHRLIADASFQKLFQLELKEGRWFDENLSTDINNVILNEKALKTFDLKVGDNFGIYGRKGKIIASVKNFYFSSFKDAIEPLVITASSKIEHQIFIKAKPKQVEEALASTNAIWTKYFPNDPMDYQFVEEAFNQLYKSEKRAGALLNLFTLITLFIACLGLYALVNFAAERRTKEIGIRKVIGASIVNIISLLTKDFLKLVVISIFIAIPIAWYVMNQWLDNFAYRIKLDWWIFVLVGLGAIGIALLTVSLQSLRAALANPVNALKND
ncbi:MAG TPA: ABC transporter permease [Saprospiraceae bacterium]|nr:ABC transporter permease [Saprospiraceae bacterium]